MLYKGRAILQLALTFGKPGEKKKKKRRAEVLKIFIFTVYVAHQYDFSRNFIFVFQSLCIGESTFSQKREGAHPFPKFVSKKIK